MHRGIPVMWARIYMRTTKVPGAIRIFYKCISNVLSFEDITGLIRVECWTHLALRVGHCVHDESSVLR